MHLKKHIGAVLFGCFIVGANSAHGQSLPAFINKWEGKTCGSGQCVAVAQDWAVADGAPIPNHAYACQYANTNPPGWRWVPNTPTGVPSPGVLVVWGAYPGAGLPYGHIAIEDYGNANAFASFDQNWPIGSKCHIQPHNYNYVLGWLHRI